MIACLDSGWLGTGPRVAELERRLGAYLDAPTAVAVSSCSAALHLALTVLDLPPGSEVITSSMTFCATANAIVHAGACRCSPTAIRDTFNIDVADVRRKITPRTRAIVPVHFAGRPCDIAALGVARARARARPHRRRRARARGDGRRAALRHVRRLRLLQLLRHEERHDRRTAGCWSRAIPGSPTGCDGSRCTA